MVSEDLGREKVVSKMMVMRRGEEDVTIRHQGAIGGLYWAGNVFGVMVSSDDWSVCFDIEVDLVPICLFDVLFIESLTLLLSVT